MKIKFQLIIFNHCKKLLYIVLNFAKSSIISCFYVQRVFLCSLKQCLKVYLEK